MIGIALVAGAISWWLALPEVVPAKLARSTDSEPVHEAEAVAAAEPVSPRATERPLEPERAPQPEQPPRTQVTAGSGTRTARCTSDADCPKGNTCCSERCVYTQIDPDHCGGCGQQCAPGMSCAGECIPPPCGDGMSCAPSEQCCGTKCCGGGQLCCLFSDRTRDEYVCTTADNGRCPARQ